MEKDLADLSSGKIAVRIIPRVIEEEMKQAYVDYAMSVIIGRALPDVRDGLKPVHRRLLYAMSEIGLFHNKPFKKCARIVGDVLGKYHPHGDQAVYEALVRLAQDFSLRYPLIKGQGNFGSLDGDKAAQMRYTEAKLNNLAEELLEDLDKETVDWRSNFDGSLKEPEVLPAKVPNLLINGSSGIAVGMATNIPPHNLKEICQAIICVINQPNISLEELRKVVPGPDFPTGGIILKSPGLFQAYQQGKGKITVKAVVEREGDKLVVREIPYQVNKAELIEQIAKLVREKKIKGIRNINDESDREGVRIVIDLKKEADPQIVLNQLYKYTRLKVSWGVHFLVLVNNEPKTLNLRELIDCYLLHRKEVIRRRTLYQLREAKKRVHILEGLIVALNNIEEVIAGLKKSRTLEDAKKFLLTTYALTELQVKAILEMRLQKLASLEQEKIKKENEDLKNKIEEYNLLLNSEEKILQLIKSDLEELKNRYGDERRSKILEEEEYLDREKLIEKETVVVTLTHQEYVKRISLRNYRTQGRGGKGIKATGMKEDDFVEHLFVCSSHAYLLLFTNWGQVYWLRVYEIPEGSRQARGQHLANLIGLRTGEKITTVIPIENFEEGCLLLATEKGLVKKTLLKEFSRPRRKGIRALTLVPGDHLVGVVLTKGNEQIVLATREGRALKFSGTDVRVMGRTARGIKGFNLNKDKVIGMVLAEEGKDLLTITQKGFGKKTPFSEYRLVKRGAKGVLNMKITEKNGKVVSIKTLKEEEEIMLISRKGLAIRIRGKSIPRMGRVTQGVRLMRLEEDDEVSTAAKIIAEEEAREG